MKKKTFLLSLCCLIFVAATTVWWGQRQNLVDSENDQIIGSIIDTRSPKEIAEDIQRGDEEIIRSIREWLNLGPDSVDLRGWDDATLEKALEEVNAPLTDLATDLKKRYGTKARLSMRIKTLESLIEKLRDKNQAKPPYTLRDVQDLAGLRLVFQRLDDLQKAVLEIEQMYDIINTQDYITNVKESGYRAIHEVIYFHRVPIELQIRTEGMDLWSEWHHGTLYKHREAILQRVGKEKLREFDRYAASLSDYIFTIENEAEGEEPVPPEGMEIFWELAPPKDRERMLPDGRPELGPVRREYRHAA